METRLDIIERYYRNAVTRAFLTAPVDLVWAHWAYRLLCFKLRLLSKEGE